MKTAIIDVGSNSVRYALLTDRTRVATKRLNSTVLSDGLFFSGKLSRDAMERTVAAIDEFCRKAREENADEIFVFATEAVRAASNGKQFTDAVYARCGIAVDVIDGATEAQIGFMGAAIDPATQTTVFDIGGASCEIMCGKTDDIAYAQSFPIGCVRLRDGANGKESVARALIENTLPDSLPATQTAVGIGGTATALGGMLHCPQRYDPRITHKSTVPVDFLHRVTNEFFAGKDMRSLYPALSPARARIIGYGALVALRILESANMQEFTVSERDNIEGYYLRKKRQR